jgi:hypothetical protein
VAGLDAPAVDLDGGGGDELAVALDDLDLAALDQPVRPLNRPLDDLVLVGVDLGMSTARRCRARRTARPP